jgi:hypothetical protein
MIVNKRFPTTGRFIDRWAYLALGVFGLMVIALVTAAIWQKPLINRTLAVPVDSRTALPPIPIQPSLWGALRVDVAAQLPAGEGATYDLQILDAQGRVIASAIKDAWSESGTWREEGESGTWSESELQTGLDLRASRAEPITIAIGVQDHTTSSGKPLNTPVQFTVQVDTGVIDDRYLWAGLLGTLCTSLLALLAVPTSGRRVIAKTLSGSEITQRATLGGPNRLLRLVVKVAGYDSCVPSVRLHLTIQDAEGTSRFSDNITLPIRYTKTDGKITGAKATYTAFILLEPRGSYGYRVAITPDEGIKKTTLIVSEEARTLVPVSGYDLSP